MNTSEALAKLQAAAQYAARSTQPLDGARSVCVQPRARFSQQELQVLLDLLRDHVEVNRK